ncbi:hypothetical protein [Caudoviricetes sp.]|nr:hypothetical protein [Caudoviricetes sp.]
MMIRESVEFFESGAFKSEFINRVAQEFARIYIDKNFSSVMEKISPQAIANLAIAEGAAEISNLLKRPTFELSRKSVYGKNK